MISGNGCIDKLARSVDQLGGERVLIATGPSLGSGSIPERLEAILGTRWTATFTECTQHAPAEAVRGLAVAIGDSQADTVVALGGSSVTDCVKLAAWELSDHGSNRPMPYVAVPTTLSAGEFTGGAGYIDPRDGTKRTLTDARLVAACVILDPQMTVLTPDRLWTSTGLKAVEHAIEAIWSRFAHPLVDAHALVALRILSRDLRESRPVDALGSRAACQIAAWMSISGVSSGGLRLSHVIGHQVGAYWNIPHGITSAVLLPAVMRYLAPVTLAEQRQIADALGVDVTAGSELECAAAAATAVEALAESLDLPTCLAAAGASIDDIDDVAQSGFIAAQALGLTGDLPRGARDIADILCAAW